MADLNQEMEDLDDEIVNLKICPCYPLKDHECYFNWVNRKFDEVTAKDRIKKRQCLKKCSDIKECDFCCFDGDWRLHVQPTLFLEGEDDDLNVDKGHFHKFVSWNSEMTFLEAFIGEHEKAESRLNYLNLAIDCCETEDLDYLDAYKYMSKTLQAFIQFHKDSLDRSDLDSLQDFKNLSPQAQIGVLSLKFIFFKETKGTFRTQAHVLRKVSYNFF